MSDESFIKYVTGLPVPESDEDERSMAKGSEPFLSREEPKLENLVCPDCLTNEDVKIHLVFAPSISTYVEIPEFHGGAADNLSTCAAALVSRLGGLGYTFNDNPDAHDLGLRPVPVKDNETKLAIYAEIWQACDGVGSDLFYQLIMPLLRG